MASLAEIGRYLKGVLDKVDKAKESLAQAADLADDAFDVLSAAGTGTTRADVEQAGARFAEVRAAVYGQGGLLVMLDAGTDLVRTIVNRIGAGGDAPAGPPAAGTGVVPAQPQVLAGKIEALRRELPPPVQPRTGQKTHGRFVVGDGPAASMISGDDADAEVAKDALREEGYPLPGDPVVATHVEMKAAARMRDEGIGQATVVINHVPCLLDLGGESLIGVVLPEGSSLTVHGAGGYQRTFTGGKQPPWRR